MSTPHVKHSPKDEIVSGFANGRLDPETSRRIGQHMSTCPHCDGTYSTAPSFESNKAVSTNDSMTRARFGSRSFRGVAGVVLAVVLVAFPIAISRLRESDAPKDGGISSLIQASRALGYRTIEGRPSGGFTYRPVKAVRRGAEDKQELTLASAAVLLQAAAMQQRSAAALHAAGVAHLLLRQADDAVAKLEQALLRKTNTQSVSVGVTHCSDAGLLNDLSVAYLLRSKSAKRVQDHFAAVEAAQKAWRIEKAPVVAWNRALAIERLSQRRDAVRAWRDFIAIEPMSDWRAEAEEHIRQLHSDTESDRWSNAQPALRHPMPTLLATQMVRRFPQRMRQWVEHDVLLCWATSLSTDASEARGCLATFAVVADALRQTTGEAATDATVRSIEHARSKDRIAAAHCLYAKALKTYEDNNFAAARESFRRAASALAEEQSPFAHWANVYSASCAYYENDFSTAVRLTTATLGEIDPAKFQAIAAYAWWVRGISRMSQAMPIDAIADYDRALRVFENAGETANVLAIRGLLATAYESLGDYERGLSFRRETLVIADQLGRDVKRLPQTLDGAARAVVRDFPETSLLLTDRELTETQRGDWSDLRATVFVRRSEIHQRLGDVAAATRDIAAANEALSHIEDRGVRGFIGTHPDLVRAQLPFSPEARLRSVNVALDFARATANRQREIELVILLGRETARTGDLDGASRILDTALARIESQYFDIRNPGLRESLLVSREDVYDDLVRFAIAKGDNAKALMYAERGRARTLHEAFAGSELPFEVGGAAVAHRTPQHTIVIDYVALPDRLLIWAMGAKRKSFKQVRVSQDQLLAEIDTAQIEDPTQFRRSMARISQWLLDPVADDLVEGSTIVFIMPDSLSTIPFASLYVKGRELASQHAVVTAPGLAIYFDCLDRSRKLRRRSGTTLVVSAGEQRAELSLERLPAADAETAAVRRALPNCRVLAGQNATKERLLRELPNAARLHVTAHGIVDVERPAFSALVLRRAGSDSGLLYAHEIARQPLGHMDLVVLAACDTLSGARRSRRGVVNIGRAFLSAGVPTVIGTLRPVDDDAATALMTAFYQALARGCTPSVALNLAQQRLMRRWPPTVWAAFQLMGGESGETNG